MKKKVVKSKLPDITTHYQTNQLSGNATMKIPKPAIRHNP
jgi:hypothetical protein